MSSDPTKIVSVLPTPSVWVTPDGHLQPNDALTEALGWPLAASERSRLVDVVHGATTLRLEPELLRRAGQIWTAVVAPSTPAGTLVQLAPAAGISTRADVLELVLDSLPINVFLKDMEGRLQVVNAASCRTIGLSREQIVGRTDAEVFGPAVGARLRSADALALAHPDTIHIHEEELLGPDGPKYMYAGKRVIELDTGEVMVLGFSLDITERKRLERELQAQRTFMRQVIDTDPNLIFVKDLAGNFRLVNQAVADLFSSTVAAIEHRPNAEVHGNQAEVDGYADVDRLVILEGKTVRTEEVVTQPDGTLRHYQTVKCPMVGIDDTTMVLGISVDITERKKNLDAIRQARDAAEAASRAKTDFLATMSHEIRTPMNGVIGMSGLLLDTSLTETQRRFAVTIRESADALLSIINDILDFSKVEAGRLELEPVDFDVVALAQGAVNIVSPRADARGLALSLSIDPQVPLWMHGDAGRIRQVLVNLIGNAVKFTNHGGVEVRISARTTPDQTVLCGEVEDSGPGISAELLPTLFEAFTQGDSTPSRRFGGTGLGLAISQRLCERMGGTIGVRSAPQQGSIFHFELPVRSCVVPRFHGMPDLAGLRVLSICPDHLDGGAPPDLLARWGAEVHTTANLAEGLQTLLMSAANGPRPDLVLLSPTAVHLTPAVRHALVGSLASVKLLVIAPPGMHLDELEPADPAITVLSADGWLPAFAPTVTRLARSSLRRGRPAIPTNATFSTPTVLVAEDNPVNQEVARLMLEREGFSVEVVATGQGAVDAIRTTAYDLVLMDIQMPGMNGLEATEAIRSLPGPAAQTPIIAMTANVMPNFRERCLDAGMQDFLGKPIDRRRLQQALRRALEGRGARLDPVEGDGLGPQDGEDPIDHGVLDEIVADLGAGAVFSLTRTMQRDGPVRCTHIVAAAATGQTDVARAEAQTLRAAAETLGMASLSRRLQDVEAAADAGKVTALRQLARALGPTLAASLTAVHTRLA